jgi:uncharacterized protein YjbI with pentapeptide repeats
MAEMVIEPITAHQFRVLLMRYQGEDRPDLNEELTGTEERPIKLAGGTYALLEGIFKQLDLRRVCFSYCEWLAGPLMPGTQAQSSQWLHTILGGSNTRSGADLSESDFSDARFTEANLSFANLTRAKLVRAHFDGGRSYQARFTSACALGSQWTDWHFGALDIARPEESYTDLSGMDLSWSHFSNVKFDRCVLDGTNFEGSVFKNCDFSLIVRGSAINFTQATAVGKSSFPMISACLNGHRPPTRYQ